MLEQERQIRQAMSNRGGVMGLLLHSTFDHDLRNRIQTQMQQEGQSQKEKGIFYFIIVSIFIQFVVI